DGVPRDGEPRAARADALLGPVGARAGAEELEPLRGEGDGGAAIACEAETLGGERGDGGEARERDARQRGADERLDDGEPARPRLHGTRTRPRWFTTTLRRRPPAASTTVPFSAVPSPPKRIRARTGTAAKATPPGSGRRAGSGSAPTTSMALAATSKRTSTGAPIASARPRASRSVVASVRAAPASRSPLASSGMRTRPSPASAAASPTVTSDSSSVKPCVPCMAHLRSAAATGGGRRRAARLLPAPAR